MIELWQEWMRAAGNAEQTVQTRRRAMEALMAHSRTADVSQLQAEHLARWLAACRTGWTRTTYWGAAHSYYRWLVGEGLREDDPMVHIPRPRPPKCLPRPVSDEVVERMLTDPLSGRSLEYTTLAVLAGLRCFEIAKIHGADVDLRTGTLFVLGKGGHEAFLPLHPRVAMLARGKPADDYWFASDGPMGHVRATSVSATLKRGLAAAGAPHAVPHQLRHSYGTAVLHTSRDLRVAQELLRHQSAASTQVYTKVSRSDQVLAIRHLPWGA